jgi:hypothetical protein
MTERNPTIVTIAEGGSGGQKTYHTNPECKGLSESTTRQIAKHKIPNSTLCKRCKHGDAFDGQYEQRSEDLNQFLKNFDATDVERGGLAERMGEECE